MAEGSESGGKASDLYIGVVDLFAVILPGALFCGLGWKVLHDWNEGREFLERVSPPEFIPKWVVFLVASYIAGHFLFALGAWIMDPLYDGYYKRHFEFNVKKELPSMRRRADRLLHEVLGRELYSEADNRLTWSQAMLTFGGAAAKGMLDRMEADSKFFRSLAVVLMLAQFCLLSPRTGWITPVEWWTLAGSALVVLLLAWLLPEKLGPKQSFDRRVKLRLLNAPPKPKPAGDAWPSRLSWTDPEWLKAEEDENKQSAARFRRFAVMIPALWTAIVVVMIGMEWKREAALIGAICWLLTIASAWRYMEIRAKRLVEAYYFLIALNKSSVFSPAPPEKKP